MGTFNNINYRSITNALELERKHANTIRHILQSFCLVVDSLWTKLERTVVTVIAYADEKVERKFTNNWYTP